MAVPSALPPVAPDELASRLGLDVDGQHADALTNAITVAIATLAGKCDPTRTLNNRESWNEAVTQLGMKVFDMGYHGLSADLSLDGEWATPTQAATSGLWRSVSGILQPCMTRGGVVAR